MSELISHWNKHYIDGCCGRFLLPGAPMEVASSGRRSCVGTAVLTLVRPINDSGGTKGSWAANRSRLCQGDCVHERSHGKSGVRPAIFTAAASVFVGAIGTATTPGEVSCDSYTEQGSASGRQVQPASKRYTRQHNQLLAVLNVPQPNCCPEHDALGKWRGSVSGRGGALAGPNLTF